MVYPIAKLIIPMIIKLYLKEVNGLENIEKRKTFIIAANHASYMDHFFIMCMIVPYINKKVHFLAKKEHFKNFLTSWWHSWAGAIPIDRQAKGEEALRWAIKALNQGKIIAIYPEGTRTLNDKLQKGKTGVARLALTAKVPVIPVGLIGTFEIMPKGRYFPRFKRAVMNIGKPVYFNKYYGKENNYRILREVTDKIMNKIADLSNQEYKNG